MLGSETFDELAGTFEAVAYGGRDRRAARPRRGAHASGRACVERSRSAGDDARASRPRPRTRTTVGRPSSIVAVRRRRRRSSLNLLARGLDRAVGGNEPSGRRGSSYATQRRRASPRTRRCSRDYGHPVRRTARRSSRRPPLDPGSTLFVTRTATRPRPRTTTTALLAVRGARRPARDRRPADSVLPAPTSATDPPVVGGVRRLPRLRRDRPAARHRPDRSRPPATARGRDPAPVASDGDRGAWRGAARPHERVGRRRDLLPRRRVAARERRTSPTPTTPRSASRSPATPARPVVFAEGVHGYGETRGLGAIPTRWKVALVRSRRRGARVRVVARPPLRTARPTGARRCRRRAPSTCARWRVTLERTHDPAAALAPLGAAVRATAIAQRAGLPRRRDRRSDRPRRDHARAAPTTRSRRCWHPPTDDDAVLALGRVVARVDTTRGPDGERAARPRGARGPQGRRRPGRRRRGAARRGRPSAATCCSKACPASPRRCSRTRSRARSASTSAACSSRPTCCRRTSPAR